MFFSGEYLDENKAESHQMPELDPQCQRSIEHEKLCKRLRKTLYYGKMPRLDRPSLAMTELTVELLHDLSPRELGKVDMYYAAELSREVCASPCSTVVAMLYMRRVQQRNPTYLHHVTSSELLLVAMMMASKYLYDEGEMEEPLNEEWANSANIDVDEINQLERAFLSAIDWKLFVSRAEFWNALMELESRIVWRKIKERGGSATYTDLAVLLDNEHLKLTSALFSVLCTLCEAVAVCYVAYVACMLPIVTSPHLLLTIQPLAISTLTLIAQIPHLIFVPITPTAGNNFQPFLHKGASFIPEPILWRPMDVLVAEWGAVSGTSNRNFLSLVEASDKFSTLTNENVGGVLSTNGLSDADRGEAILSNGLSDAECGTDLHFRVSSNRIAGWDQGNNEISDTVSETCRKTIMRNNQMKVGHNQGTNGLKDISPSIIQLLNNNLSIEEPSYIEQNHVDLNVHEGNVSETNFSFARVVESYSELFQHNHTSSERHLIGNTGILPENLSAAEIDTRNVSRAVYYHIEDCTEVNPVSSSKVIETF